MYKHIEKHEKKLTDEEIVKALECCANFSTQKDCDLCPIGVIKCFEQENLMQQLALDLINRLKESRKTFFRIAKQRNGEKRELEKKVEELQTEIEELRNAKVIYATVDYCYEDLKEAQVEIERLSKKAVALEVETNNQKAEIERLKEYNLNLNGMNLEFIDKNAELQKQVDELRTSREIEINELHEQHAIVAEEIKKDTAKEIFTDLLKEFSIRKSCGNADIVVKEVAQRYGVEVE